MSNSERQQTSLQRITLLMVLLNAFSTPLMLSAAYVALPVISQDLKVNAVLLSWVPMAFLMASAMFVLVFGRLADMFGRKRIFLLGTFGGILTSILAAVSSSGETLVFARFLQGTCAAMLYATQIALVSSVFPATERGRAIGLTVSTIYLGLTAGPLIGGFLIESFGWRTGFIFHIPLALIVLIIGLWKVQGEWKSDDPGQFDSKGALLYPLTIVLFCFAVSTLPDSRGFVFLMLAFAGLWYFFRLEHRTEHPVFDVRLFYTNRVFTFSCLASLIMYTATFANVVMVSLYLQFIKGMSASMAGIIMMTQPLAMAVFSPLAGSLSDRFEAKWLASCGVGLTLFGLLLLSLLNAQSPVWYLCMALIITGFGFGFFSSPNVNAIMSTVEKRYYGSATGAVATMRIIGQLTSMALVTMVFALMIGAVEIDSSNYPQLESAIRIVFLISALFCIPGLFFSLNRGQIHKVSKGG